MEKNITIEDKAKAYDEAIKRGLDYIKHAPATEMVTRQDIFEVIFPELKESENERIRQKLLFLCYSWRNNEQVNIPDKKEVEKTIAWLEKQGEKASDKIVEKARTEKQRVLLTETDGSANIDWNCRSLDDVKILLKCGLEFIRTIEANKQILTDNRFGGCSFRVPTRYDKGIKRGDDKVEPKFKIGDTIVEKDIDECGYGTIKDIKDGQYIFTDGSGMNINEQDGWELVKTSTNIKQKPADKVEPKFKVGDTIVEKDIDECGYGTIKDIKDGQYIFTDGSGMNINEQDGWELVKTSTNIKQKPADKVEPKFKVGDWTVSNLDKKARQISEVHFDEYNSYYVVNEKSVNLEEYDRLHHLWTIIDAKDGDVLISEEGFPFIYTKYLSAYCGITNYGAFKISDKTGLWTNDNVEPANKEQRDLLFQKMKEAGYEWDADKKELKKNNSYCQENCKGYQETGKCFADGDCKAKIEAEQNLTWSEDEEKIRASMIEDYTEKVNSTLNADLANYFNKCIDFLKNKNTWKPSKEQMRILSIYADQNNREGSILTSLYQDLKKKL